MALNTLYNYNPNTPTQITREQYTNVGSSDNTLGTAPRAVKGSTDFEIWDSAAGGTQLTEGVDYELRRLDSKLTSQSGFNVYGGYRILNATYQTGSIYITYKIIASYDDAAFYNTMRTDLDTILGVLGNVKVLTYSDSPYTIGDTDGFDRFLIDPSAGEISITLPTLADNSEKIYTFIQTTNGGKVTIDGEGSENIGGFSTLYFQGINDRLEITADTTQWQIKHYHATYFTGWINNNDWTNRHLGTSQFDYDNLSGTFRLGETITEATSSNTGIIQADTGSVLTVKNVTGTGIWTNNRQITGAASSATADVNEVAGSNKNQDTNVIHDFNFNLVDVRIKIYFSTDGTEANAFFLDFSDSAAGGFGGTFYQISLDEIKMQMAGSGYLYTSDAGTVLALNTQDWYYKIKVEVTI
jgi:hypothetical protein